MTVDTKVRGLTRRQLLASGAAMGALVVGPGFVAHPTAAWAVETKALSPEQMATLIQMARDIYPHDQVPDRFYAQAVKGHDEKAAEDAETRRMLTEGLDDLDARARQFGAEAYVDIGWEADRVAILKAVEGTDFFDTIRSGLVVGLYNQTDLWPLFGYEGASYEHGGYIHRGFNDIDWL